ncbi:hypothetical protein S40288_11118 [Stachybotrys chartarum IBT 40288]|nr:hypothetical protein S40288_11118 [Stachybotrys chartarum IBT 40288]
MAISTGILPDPLPPRPTPYNASAVSFSCDVLQMPWLSFADSGDRSSMTITATTKQDWVQHVPSPKKHLQKPVFIQPRIVRLPLLPAKGPYYADPVSRPPVPPSPASPALAPPRRNIFAGSVLGSSFMATDTDDSEWSRFGREYDLKVCGIQPQASKDRALAQPTSPVPPRRNIFAGSVLGSSFMATDTDDSEWSRFGHEYDLKVRGIQPQASEDRIAAPPLSPVALRRNIFAGSILGSSFMATDTDDSEWSRAGHEYDLQVRGIQPLVPEEYLATQSPHRDLEQDDGQIQCAQSVTPFDMGPTLPTNDESPEAPGNDMIVFDDGHNIEDGLDTGSEHTFSSEPAEDEYMFESKCYWLYHFVHGYLVEEDDAIHRAPDLDAASEHFSEHTVSSEPAEDVNSDTASEHTFLSERFEDVYMFEWKCYLLYHFVHGSLGEKDGPMVPISDWPPALSDPSISSEEEPAVHPVAPASTVLSDSSSSSEEEPPAHPAAPASPDLSGSSFWSKEEAPAHPVLPASPGLSGSSFWSEEDVTPFRPSEILTHTLASNEAMAVPFSRPTFARDLDIQIDHDRSDQECSPSSTGFFKNTIVKTLAITAAAATVIGVGSWLFF